VFSCAVGWAICQSPCLQSQEDVSFDQPGINASRSVIFSNGKGNAPHPSTSAYADAGARQQIAPASLNHEFNVFNRRLLLLDLARPLYRSRAYYAPLVHWFSRERGPYTGALMDSSRETPLTEKGTVKTGSTINPPSVARISARFRGVLGLHSRVVMW
jgi:hypothetical protein